MNDVEEDIAYVESCYEPAAPPRNRTTPSGAVAWALEKLKQEHYPSHRAADIGCGKGRNTLFLARKGMDVTAMDFSLNAIETLNKMAIRQKVRDKIRAFAYDITEDWPIEPHSMDLVIDTFCFKHLDNKLSLQTYKENLLRALNTRGHYLISLGSIGDGYYGRYMRHRNQASMPVDDAVKIDPVNGIESPIFSREKIIKFFSPEFELHHELKSLDQYDKAKDDGAYALLFRRAPKWFYT